LNLALIVLIGATGWRLNSAMNQAEAKENSIVGKPLEQVEPPPPNPVDPPSPLSPGDYYDVARFLLFFPDRNPDVVIETAPPPPLPPMPVAHGVLDLGSGPTIILSEDDKAQQRAYQVGDVYEEFVISQISDTGVVFEWEGELISRSIEELKPAVKLPARTKTAASKPQPSVAKPKGQVLGKEIAGPSEIDMGGGIRACQPGDTTAAGTVVGGFKKVMSQTPFGNVCRWEPSQ
jgi:hypothetical protein